MFCPHEPEIMRGVIQISYTNRCRDGQNGNSSRNFCGLQSKLHRTSIADLRPHRVGIQDLTWYHKSRVNHEHWKTKKSWPCIVRTVSLSIPQVCRPTVAMAWLEKKLVLPSTRYASGRLGSHWFSYSLVRLANWGRGFHRLSAVDRQASRPQH